MKKLNLFLSAALLLCASAMIAQTTIYTSNSFFDNSVPNQWANQVMPQQAPGLAADATCVIPQVSTMTFTGLSVENLNLMSQTGSYNDANVYQTGDSNYSSINQDGADSYLSAGGSYNDAEVYQSGMANYSDVGQDGDFNVSDVIQMGTSNYAKQQVGAGWAEHNDTYVYQDGSGNASSQTQFYDGNDARVEQTTNNNQATQWQSSTDSHLAGTGNDASIMQYGGDGNNAFQKQTGTLNNAWTEQAGASNESSTVQSGVSSSLYSNWARTLQFGDNNKACVNQVTTAGINGSAIYQSGDLNVANVDQQSNSTGYMGNLSYISQYGNNNNAAVFQMNSSN